MHRRVGKAATFGLRWLLPDDVELVAAMVSRHWPDTVALFRPSLDRSDQDLAPAAGLPLVAMVGEKERPGGSPTRCGTGPR